MSGGAYRYVDDFAAAMKQSGTPLRQAFGAHLELIATAMHDIEWVDARGYRTGEEEASIRACMPEDIEFRQAIADAEAALGTLARLVETAKQHGGALAGEEG